MDMNGGHLPVVATNKKAFESTDSQAREADLECGLWRRAVVYRKHECALETQTARE